MTFKRISVQPASIQTVRITLEQSVNSDEQTVQLATYRVDVVMTDGTLKRVDGDLKPHISASQKDQLSAFLSAMYQQAQAQLL